jgi:hypothetical protein
MDMLPACWTSWSNEWVDGWTGRAILACRFDDITAAPLQPVVRTQQRACSLLPTCTP